MSAPKVLLFRELLGLCPLCKAKGDEPYARTYCPDLAREILEREAKSASGSR